MPDMEKAIRILEGSYKNFVLRHNGELLTVNELIALLKAQEAVVMSGAELTDAELIEAIRKAPLVLKQNVDAVPVVRCRSCKHRDPEDKKCDYGGMAVQGLFFPRPDNWFCADGERRDEDA